MRHFEGRDRVAGRARWHASGIRRVVCASILCAACDSEDPVEPVAALQLAAVSAGLHHTCGLTPDSTAYCWGRNTEGESGDGTSTNRVRPVPVATSLKFASMTAGTFHTCALTAAGVAYCWGWNLSGSLGVGDTDRRLVPTAVVGGQHFERLESGDEVTCGITRERDPYCWGWNRSGQLGALTTETCSAWACATVPLRVETPTPLGAVVPGGTMTCALDLDGAASCWGQNDYGQLGNGTRDASGPQPVTGSLAFREIAPGLAHVCAITAAGHAYCWGDNGAGQLGAVASDACGNITCSSVPLRVSGDVTFRSIGTGSFHSCGLATNGTAYCWGKGDDGQLGNGALEPINGTPIPVSGNLRFAQLSVGWFHNCGITTAGDTYCWGWNNEGPLGSGSVAPSPIPRPVLPP